MLEKIMHYAQEYKDGKIDFLTLESEVDALLSARNNSNTIHESTFAVGKKLKVEHCFYGHEFNIGEVVTIIGHDGEDTTSWLCTNGKKNWWLTDSEASVC